jgi:hypothetical protein
MVTVHRWILQSHVAPIAPPNLHAFHLCDAAQSEMNCVGLLGTEGVSGYNLPRHDSASMAQSNRGTYWRRAAAFLAEAKANPVAGIG